MDRTPNICTVCTVCTETEYSPNTETIESVERVADAERVRIDSVGHWREAICVFIFLPCFLNHLILPVALVYD